MRRLRWIAWGVVGAVVVTVLAAPPLREQARMQWAVVSRGDWGVASGWEDTSTGDFPGLLGLGWASALAQAMPAPHDADPDLAEAYLRCTLLAWTDNGEWRRWARVAAAHQGPVTAALSADLAMKGLQVGTDLVYPYDKDKSSSLRRETCLPPGKVARLEAALSRWQEADPENGLPLVLRAWLLYGLGRDAEARATWLAAASCPECTWPKAGLQALSRQALVSRGVPLPEAWFVADTCDVSVFRSRFRDAARLATNDGLRLQARGQHNQGARLWQATVLIGERFSEGGADLIDFLVGRAVQAIGGAPVWAYYRTPGPGPAGNQVVSKASAAFTGGPFGDGGEFRPGKQHKAFVAALGKRADDALRDRLVAGKTRTSLARGHWLGATQDLFARLDRAAYLLGCGALAGVQGMVLFLLALGGGLLGRRSLAPSPRQLLPYVPPVLLAAVAAPAAALAISRQQQLVPHLLVAFYWGLLVLPIGVVVVLAVFTRGEGRLRRWARGVAMLAPVALAVTAVGYLAVSLDAAVTRAALTREIAAGGWTEMGMLKRSVGPAWEHPKIPKGAWRNEPVPPAR